MKSLTNIWTFCRVIESTSSELRKRRQRKSIDNFQLNPQPMDEETTNREFPLERGFPAGEFPPESRTPAGEFPPEIGIPAGEFHRRVGLQPASFHRRVGFQPAIEFPPDWGFLQGFTQLFFTAAVILSTYSVLLCSCWLERNLMFIQLKILNISDC